jgi:hypothetical protein
LECWGVGVGVQLGVTIDTASLAHSNPGPAITITKGRNSPDPHSGCKSGRAIPIMGLCLHIQVGCMQMQTLKSRTVTEILNRRITLGNQCFFFHFEASPITSRQTQRHRTSAL